MRTFIIVMSAAAAPFSWPALAQQPDTTSIRDFSGIWAHPTTAGFEPPASGPRPVVNKSRVRGGPNDGVANFRELVGDYATLILAL
jgi:hypothetical protein